MADMSYTPGPWAYRDSVEGFRGDYCVTQGVDPTGKDELASVWSCGAEGPDEAEANARLIAAAPDLLAACKFACSAIDNYLGKDPEGVDPDMSGACQQLAEAIERAEG